MSLIKVWKVDICGYNIVTIEILCYVVRNIGVNYMTPYPIIYTITT